MKQKRNSEMLTPVKGVKGMSEQTKQFNRAADGLFSTAVSRVRQPIESLFNWLIEKLIFKELARYVLVKVCWLTFLVDMLPLLFP